MTLAGLLLVGFGFAGTQLMFPCDIRPNAVKREVTADSTREARRLLALLGARYGGLDRYRLHRVTQVEYTDEWASGLMRRFGTPWQPGERLRFTFANGTDNSRLDFLSGPRAGQSWGIQQWQTYVVRTGQRTFAANKDIKFWLPTIEYFIEMPFRIGDAQIAAHAGTKTLNDQTYDLIYLTWGSPAPQRHIDQYVAWIRRSDGILEFVEYTVRDIAPFMTGCIHYEDLRDIDGVLLPFRMTLGDCPGKPGLLHRQTLEAARFLRDLPLRELLPEPDRRASKND
jgi:hypothetical protein